MAWYQWLASFRNCILLPDGIPAACDERSGKGQWKENKFCILFEQLHPDKIVPLCTVVVCTAKSVLSSCLSFLHKSLIFQVLTFHLCWVLFESTGSDSFLLLCVHTNPTLTVASSKFPGIFPVVTTSVTWGPLSIVPLNLTVLFSKVKVTLSPQAKIKVNGIFMFTWHDHPFIFTLFYVIFT